MKKQYIYEIATIIVASIIIGLVYNFLQPKPVSLIYKKKEFAKLGDEVLFGDNTNKAKSDDLENISDKTVTYEQMLKIINNDDFIIIDARSADNFNKMKIGNAVNIFPYDEETIVMNKIFDLPQNKKIVVYCDGGNCDSSHKIAEILLNFGYDNSYIYSGGWDEWSKKQGIE
jgi:rhodanese-related sulfurtransferase